MKATYQLYTLKFKTPGGTSRGVLTTKDTYILEITDGHRKGIGECGLFRGLSCDDVPDYEQRLDWLCENIDQDRTLLQNALKDYPSIWIGYEQAMQNLEYGGTLYFPSEFTQGEASITINGLIWMGDTEYMKTQIEDKLKLGFSCIKLKIGIRWEEEKAILKQLRQLFPKQDLELRVDANGAFSFEDAQRVLEQLAALDIHSIEQPIKAGQVEHMQNLCLNTPTPIALDEELIGINNTEAKQQLIETIKPQYIILKPSLVGGFSGTDEWISIVEQNGSGWWITSALESNIGLNAIAQYTYIKNNKMPQGLGTGGLFTNNFDSFLILERDKMWFTKNT
ncbi:o-succinylbenzoate synthase [Riemerella columbina]|uniref:o-succinylbenzoate synthase n=1 Tax=Riemerella columbina TaxID=103810 RepID=UPI00035D5418|nr:o-succinylbenzoate synthase [Riemerella columbina]